ncbi:hypothetical protein HRW09_36085, partial [Streptomyces lunaelactis]|uniref:hypothetical protein n=1 Tax=Streptomyces lunaelactis TaxID=1535768 RepID=UPI001C2FCA23
MAGPFQQIPLDDNKSADFYLLRYDDAGRLRSPLAEQEVKGKLAEVTDVFFFAHGWNNIFAKALDRYRKFIIGYIEQRKTFAIPAAENYTPLLIGTVRSRGGGDA